MSCQKACAQCPCQKGSMKPVKRLRGHGFELAKLEKEPLAKGYGEQSVLAQTLLSLCSDGQLSAKLVQDVAHKAILTWVEWP